MMATLGDSSFRYSANLHSLDWRKIAKLSVPLLNDGKIDYRTFIAFYMQWISELPDLPGPILSRPDPEIIRSSEETRSSRS